MKNLGQEASVARAVSSKKNGSKLGQIMKVIWARLRILGVMGNHCTVWETGVTKSDLPS